MAESKLKPVVNEETLVEFQSASIDIWDKKYRLKTKDGDPLDQDINATYELGASALAEF